MQWCSTALLLSDTGKFPSPWFPVLIVLAGLALAGCGPLSMSPRVWFCGGYWWWSLIESLSSLRSSYSSPVVSVRFCRLVVPWSHPVRAFGGAANACRFLSSDSLRHTTFPSVIKCLRGSVKLTHSQFRAYTDPLTTTTTSNNLTPPSVPPPPPPPPLNIPPSRARMAFAARLASKRKAEEGGSDPDEQEERGLGKGGMSALMQRSDAGAIRNPFADDEDEEGSDEEGSDDDEEDGDLGAGAGGSSSSWNRGGWWRGALGGKKQSKMPSEKFGDGRDSEDEEEEGEGEGGANSSEDEEFGDFAMPEGQAGDVAGGIDEERDNVLVKPLPVHPPPGAAGVSAGNKGLMGLWPFTKKDKDKEGDEADDAEAAENEKAAEDVEEEEKKETEHEPPVVLSEDGEKVQPTVEAKRRTSIEEPDEGEDEEVVV